MKSLLFAIALLVTAVPVCAATPMRPNILFILAHDLPPGIIEPAAGKNDYSTPKIAN